MTHNTNQELHLYTTHTHTLTITCLDALSSCARARIWISTALCYSTMSRSPSPTESPALRCVKGQRQCHGAAQTPLAKADSPSPRGCCSERKRSQGMWGMADLQTSFAQNQINLIITQRETSWLFWLPDFKANKIKC